MQRMAKSTTLARMVIAGLAVFLAPAAKAQSDLDALVRDNTAFAMDLYGKLATTQGNLAFSPYSISAALGMAYAGARGNTEKEMATALRFSLGQTELHPAFGQLKAQLAKTERNGVRLRVVNGLWPQTGHPFLEDFLSLAETHYGVATTPLDYRSAYEPARVTINQWVEHRTEGKIRGLLQPGDLSDYTRLVLVNAVYFKERWASQFRERDTKHAPFHVSPDKTVRAPMMTQKQMCLHASLPQMDVLALPYVGSDLWMVVLLPKEIDGIREVEGELSAERLATWLNALSAREVLVFLPRFKATSGFGLNDTLASLGMVDAFSREKANFAGMDGQTDWLHISAAVHKAFVEVNEEGTEAATTTAVISKAESFHETPVFRADHPFIFLIRERRTGSILFAGRLSDPTPSGG